MDLLADSRYNGTHMKKYGLIITAVLLIASIAGVFFAIRIPVEITAQVPVVSYTHSARFDYQVYLKPSYLLGPEPVTPTPTPTPPPLSNLKYPLADLEKFHFDYNYRLEPLKPANSSVSAIVTASVIWRNSEGNQEKTELLPLTQTGGNFLVNFDLILTPEMLGDNITVEICVYPVVETSTGPVYDLFKQSLPLRPGDGVIEVERKALELTRTDYLGEVSYRQEGKISFSAVFKADSPQGPKTVTPPPVITPTPTQPPSPEPKILRPGETIYTRLAEKMTGVLDYRFQANQPVRDLKVEADLNLVLEGGDLWKKTLELVSPMEGSSGIKIPFTLDFGKINQLLENIRNETGISADTNKLSIRADIHVTGQTDFGKIDETFTPSLSAPLGKGTLVFEEKPQQSRDGAITISRVMPNNKRYLGLSRSGIRTLSIILMVILLLALVGQVYLFIRGKRPVITPTARESLGIQQRYGERIAEAIGQIPGTPERTVSLGSMEDLIKVADELGKPIIHQSAGEIGDVHAYYVIDATTRYQFILASDEVKDLIRPKKPEYPFTPRSTLDS